MNLQRYNSSFSRSSIYLPSLVIKNISKIGQHAQLVASAIFYIQCVVFITKSFYMMGLAVVYHELMFELFHIIFISAQCFHYTIKGFISCFHRKMA